MKSETTDVRRLHMCQKNWKTKRKMPDSVFIFYCLWMTGEKGGNELWRSISPVTVTDERTGETLEKGSNGH